MQVMDPSSSLPGRRWLRRWLASNPTTDRAIRRLRRTTALVALQAEVQALRGALERVEGALVVTPSVAPFVTWAPPGHFFSPVPDMAELEGRIEDLCNAARTPAGVDLRTDAQLALFSKLAALARSASLPEEPGGAAGRYGMDNPSYRANQEIR